MQYNLTLTKNLHKLRLSKKGAAANIKKVATIMMMNILNGIENFVVNSTFYKEYLINLSEEMRNPYVIFIFYLVFAFLIIRTVRRLVLSAVQRIKHKRRERTEI